MAHKRLPALAPIQKTLSNAIAFDAFEILAMLQMIDGEKHSKTRSAASLESHPARHV